MRTESNRPLPPPPSDTEIRSSVASRHMGMTRGDHLGMSRGDHGVPPIPERNYSTPKGIPLNPSVMSNRPLPKRPDEAYQRLLHNQVIILYHLLDYIANSAEDKLTIFILNFPEE